MEGIQQLKSKFLRGKKYSGYPVDVHLKLSSCTVGLSVWDQSISFVCYCNGRSYLELFIPIPRVCG